MSPYSLLLLPFLIFIDLPKAVETYPNCPSYMCGRVNISYPFWNIDSQSTTQFCGYEGFGINCSSIGEQSNPYVSLGGDSYYVLSINSDNIIIADRDVFPDARSSNFCPRVRHKINLGSLPLSFSTSTTNLSFHFNCTGCPSFTTGISCLDERGGKGKACVMFMNTSMDEPDWDRGICTEKVVTKVLSEHRFVDLSMDFRRVLDTGFELQWWRTPECKKCEQSGGLCGNGTTGFNKTGFICFCSDGTTIRGDYFYLGDCGGSVSNVIGPVLGGVSALLYIMSFVIIYLCLKPPSSHCVPSLKHKAEEDKNIEAFVMHYGSLSTQRYSYNDIMKMTNSFKVKLGQGGFGQVFKGKLSDGRLVAVKLLSSSKANGQEFINEVASIGRTSHVNIVTLLGFCFDCKKRALVYEYMPNGSLEKFIHSHVHIGTSEQIGVTKLYGIALGVARGLDYLHRGCNTRILHLDIKPHNILLDEDFCPKIADFGLAKLYSRKESIVSMLEARGTIGYIAPEVYNKNFGGVSHKSDVYSYGMLLLEMVGGRKNIDVGVGSGRMSEIYFPDWIYNRLGTNDFLLDSITTIEENDYVRKMTIVGLWCIQPAPNQRPSISEVIEMFEGSMEALEVPPKPYFYSPPRSPATIYSTSESMP